MVSISIVGATGYTGGELIRILLKHPHVKLVHLTSESNAGKPISAIHPWLKGRLDIVCQRYEVNRIAADSDVVFLCLPHGTAFLPAAELSARKKKIIDLSADFRLKNPKTYKHWYALSHPEPGLIKQAVYGSPELYRKKIARASLVANPGCYATAVILALAPLAKKKLITRSVIADAKSGVSGAGKKLNLMYHYAEANENLLAYAVGHHRHAPEIEQELTRLYTKPLTISMTPHLVPMSRGILVTSYAPLTRALTREQLIKEYKKYYRNDPFIVVLPPGEFPETKSVAGTNYCHIGVHVDTHTRTAIIVSVIDNLIKGASGQAVQNLNLMCGFSETEGL
ncbi:MAG: N-acetyl-gamma-glutamyl-phosphate reductase [Elusimicrobia bacterium]|nr:N-acetyl-gamma-glutamyl-phosphate reductase [Elusimicrobiota bacterium]MBD3411637.1 N-acetyl-gamma-glutamyl-phosphate reductase [Elusimicrobiota bacterium]